MCERESVCVRKCGREERESVLERERREREWGEREREERESVGVLGKLVEKKWVQRDREWGGRGERVGS